MATHNPYLAYKRDTSRLIYWIVQTSNKVISSVPVLPDDAPKTPNTDGQVTVNGLVSLAKLIAQHVDPTPNAILALFHRVINSRQTMYESFRAMVSGKPDPEIEQSNATHKYFIDALSAAFKSLGGDAWSKAHTGSTGTATKNPKPSSDDAVAGSDDDDIEQILFANKFSSLKLDGDGDQDDDGDEEEDDGFGSIPQSSSQPKRQAKPGKGKKGKKGGGKKKAKKQSQTQPQTSAAKKGPNLEDVPVESYRIIQDKEGIMTEYLMAVYSLAQEWIALRSYVQDVWRDVAYSKLNSAVAGTLSNVAIKMIKTSESAMFLEFPGHDSFKTVMDTITRGNPDKAQDMFTVGLHQVSRDGSMFRKVTERSVDVREQFMIHTYDALVDFVTDFQKTRTGKPTKPMLAQINNWQPYMDLREATSTERLRWRRAYIINWLYDVVNVFSSIVSQRISQKGEHHRLDLTDWSPSGPWDMHRRIYGIKEFAGVVTHLAFQKPGTDITSKILPHHVFQLQCIVDSMTVWRGWSTSVLLGHILKAPARDFRPRRDVDLFLDRKNERVGNGFACSVDLLKQLFERESVLNNDLDRHKLQYDLLEGVQYDFVNWLGESKYMYGLNGIPPTRFADSDSNGMWEFSPFLCGTGLEEALIEAYRYSFMVMDRLPEPILLVHLHNMLVKKGYIQQPIGLYSTFEDLFPDAFYVDGKALDDNFHEAFMKRSNLMLQRRRMKTPAAKMTDADMNALKDNDFFKSNSMLMLLSAADWDIDRIPDVDIPMPSFIATMKLGNTKRVVDSVSGKVRLEQTKFVRSLKEKGRTDAQLLGIHDTWGQITARLSSAKESRKAQHAAAAPGIMDPLTRQGYTQTNLDDTRSRLKGGKDQVLAADELLNFIRTDLVGDVCGVMPVSGFNYVFGMFRFMMQFEQFETELKKTQNPLYINAYETNPLWKKQKRVGLTSLALSEQDDECLRIMAHEFQNPRSGFMQHIYWEDLETEIGMGPTTPAGSPEENMTCTVM